MPGLLYFDWAVHLLDEKWKSEQFSFKFSSVKGFDGDKMKALGFLETRSLTAAIEASDAMTKAADVWVVGTEKIGSGLVNVVIEGDVDAVTAAVAAGEAVAREIGEVYATNVIPRPHDEVVRVLPTI